MSEQPTVPVAQRPARVAQPARHGLGRGFWIMLAAALGYCLWLGVHWLPLDWSAQELSALASRVWDVKRELVAHHRLPWWTPNFMSGSAYGLLHTHSSFLVPWLLFSTFTSLAVAGKLTTLLAIFASAVTMYFCARYFLRNDWAAVLAALGYLLHPQLLNRGLGGEHLTISMSIPLVPLLWLTFARALQSNRRRDAFWCALVVAGMLWTDNKQVLANLVLLTGYLVYWLWPVDRRRQWVATARTCATISVLGMALAAFVIVPALTEMKQVKLFYGEPLTGWQQTYSFKSFVAALDRNGVIGDLTSAGVSADPEMQAVQQRVQSRGGQATMEEYALLTKAMRVRMIGGAEKYAGLGWLAAVVVVILFNNRRSDRALFWLFVALLLISFMLSTGLSNVWNANVQSLDAVFGLPSTPVAVKLTIGVALAGAGCFLWQFWRRKLTTTPKKLIAGGALATFLFLPAFSALALLPLFKEIRAPYVFWDVPEAFIGAMLLGFLVTDVLASDRWRTHTPQVVGALATLLLLDYWPHQKPAFANGVPAHTITNLRASYAALASDPDPVKTYNISGRYFHLLGPMWSGKPQVYEAWVNWMCPLGTGLLNQQAFAGANSAALVQNHRTFLNMLSARYVVYDKSDPSAGANQQLLMLYRQIFPVFVENEDFVVFRNDSARPYVSACTKACLFVGDVHQSPQLAVTLAAQNYTLIQAVNEEEARNPDRFAQIYRAGSMVFPPIGDSAPVALRNVRVTRPDSETIRIQLTAPTNCTAVISESYYPFWHATVDGKPGEALRVDCALLGVQVPAGTHAIVLHYQPPKTYALAGMISLLVLFTGIIGCWRAQRVAP